MVNIQMVKDIKYQESVDNETCGSYYKLVRKKKS